MPEDKLALDFLEPGQREYLRRKAEEGGCTPAEVLRQVVEREMRSSQEKEPGRERIMRLAGMVSDPVVAGENFHDYLYGEDRED